MKKAFFICFTGVDGSGKTSQARNLVKDLAKSGFKAKYVYGRWRSYLPRPATFIGRLLFFRKANMFQDYQRFSSTKRKLMKNRFLFQSYKLVFFLDYFFQSLFKIKIPLMLGKNIVVDRYIYDTLITDFASYLAYRPEKIYKILERYFRFLPKPDMVFLLDLPPEIAYRRKGDIPSLDYLVERRSFYLEIAQRYNMELLDATKAEKELEQIICLKVWEELTGKGKKICPTIELLRLIGSPFVQENLKASGKDDLKMKADNICDYAVTNKIGLLYLETLAGKGQLGELAGIHESLKQRYANSLAEMSKLSRILTKAAIGYIIFKTII